MTEPSRAQQIRRSLEQHQATEGPKETLTVPLQRGSAVLPVVTLPLSVPVLNAKSFRIAPKLADHPAPHQLTQDFTAVLSRAAVKAATQARTSSSVWPADSWTRIRALPCAVLGDARRSRHTATGLLLLATPNERRKQQVAASVIAQLQILRRVSHRPTRPMCVSL